MGDIKVIWDIDVLGMKNGEGVLDKEIFARGGKVGKSELRFSFGFGLF